MAEWGKEAEYERNERLREQVRRIKGTGKSDLKRDHAYYVERSQDTSLSMRQRRQWEQLATELATRLGLNAPPSVQDELIPLDQIKE